MTPLWHTLYLVLCLGNPAQPGEDEIVARILELQEQIDELLQQLSPESREAIRQRLADSGRPLPPGAVEAGSKAASPDPSEPATAAPEPAAPLRVTEAGLAAPRDAAARCNTLTFFDDNNDGNVNGSDRLWRYLYGWVDRNDDGTMQEDEIKHLFEHGVAEIAVRLNRYRTRKDAAGDVWTDGDRIVLDLYRRKRSERAILLVDASALKRAVGSELLSATGEGLEGIQPFAKELGLRLADGTEHRLNCP